VVRFVHGEVIVECEIDAAVASYTIETEPEQSEKSGLLEAIFSREKKEVGYENRRGLCGLIRLDLAGEDRSEIHHRWYIVQ